MLFKHALFRDNFLFTNLKKLYLQNTIINNMSEEFTYIDIAKGIGIFLVVLGHYVNPFFMPDYFQHIVNFVYTFHMPLFMAMSGFLFGKSFGKVNNYRSFVLKKSQRLLIPYFTISILLFGIKYICGFFDPIEISGRIKQPFFPYFLTT